jgi:hypothetical protein
VFRREKNTYIYIGDLFFHPNAFRVLPLGADGRPRILIYLRDGGGVGRLEVVINDGRKFQTVSSEIIHPDDGGADEGKYEELFAHNTALKPVTITRQ